jgi:hypothetical protein
MSTPNLPNLEKSFAQSSGFFLGFRIAMSVFLRWGFRLDSRSTEIYNAVLQEVPPLFPKTNAEPSTPGSPQKVQILLWITE